MKYNIKEMSNNEKPRAKLKKLGVKALTDVELLAIVLTTGTKEKSVLDLSIEVCDYLSINKSINDITMDELLEIKGIGEAKAMILLAALEFTNRLITKNEKEVDARDLVSLYHYVKFDLVNEIQEKLICIYVDTQYKVILKKEINVGSIQETTVDIKACIRWGIKVACSGIVFIHNHPSGDPTPSQYDVFETKKFEQATKYLEMEFLDHLIIGKNSFYSFRKNRIIQVKS